MPGVITTGNLPKLLWPGLFGIFGTNYSELTMQWPDLFDKETSKQAYEEVQQVVGFPLARVKGQGAPVQYVGEQQGYTVRYTNVVYALGFIVSWEEELNNLYETVSKRRTKSLAFSMRQTKEINAANVYNRAFDGTNYPMADAVALVSASHPTASGLQSNTLSAAADISETAIEDLMTAIMSATDANGLHIGLQGMSLHVAPANWYEANRILKSVLQNDTALNAVNVLKSTNALPKGIKVNNYFTDTDAWFIRTNCPNGMTFFERLPYQFAEDNDFDTKNHKYAATDYYSFGCTDWLALFGSAGA
jgi:hypothetical protein